MTNGEKACIILAFVAWGLGFPFAVYVVAALIRCALGDLGSDILLSGETLMYAAHAIGLAAAGAVLFRLNNRFAAKEDEEYAEPIGEDIKKASEPEANTAPTPSVFKFPEDTESRIVVRTGFVLAANIIASIFVLACSLSFFFADYLPDYGLITGLYGQVILMAVGITFGWRGLISKSRPMVLTSAILYCVATVSFFIFALVTVLPIIFAFVGYSRMRPRRIMIIDGVEVERV